MKDKTKCDRCGTILTIRPENTKENIRKAYYSWRSSISQMVNLLRKAKVFFKVNTDDDIDEAASKIKDFMERDHD